MPEGTPEGLRRLLEKVVQTKKAESFQTTIIAAQFALDGQVVVARVLKCGDSALFAFSPDGELLMSSLALASPGPSAEPLRKQAHRESSHRDPVSFGPGDEILVRIDGPLSEYKSIAQAAGIESIPPPEVEA
jgi:hypothetical protein